MIKTVRAMQSAAKGHREAGRTVGLVPTMGYFHEGHLSLMRAARGRDDVVVVSLFVNPTQFGPGEDYDRYPRDEDRDAALAEQVGVDVLFVPSVEEMYPEGDVTTVEVAKLTDGMCGAFRPGHFRGVTTVCVKLFNITMPHRAYFGLKDYQQYVVIRRMVRDLHLDLEIVACPTVREPDGLAMSSRNELLSAEEREAALVLSRALCAAEEMIRSGETSADVVREAVREAVQAEPLARLQYVEVADAETLAPLERVGGRVVVALAAHVGPTRLIDNYIVEV
ncbi:MAG: pantoate--beta-alanine ligase [Armatimonadota bacterium]